MQQWYANEEVDRLVVKGRETLDRAAREKVYQELFRALVEDPPLHLPPRPGLGLGQARHEPFSFNMFVGNASQYLLFK